MQTAFRVNVAPSSDEGHYVESDDHRAVILDEVNETAFVPGPSRLVTENHTTLEQPEPVLITCQRVVNPLTGLLERSRD